jgi:hypothetical protein
LTNFNESRYECHVTEAARGLLIALKMEAASTSETSVNFYTAQNPDDSQLHIRRRENLKSHKIQPLSLLSCC